MRITLDAQYGIYPLTLRRGIGVGPLKLCAPLPAGKAIQAANALSAVR